MKVYKFIVWHDDWHNSYVNVIAKNKKNALKLFRVQCRCPISKRVENHWTYEGSTDLRITEERVI